MKRSRLSPWEWAFLVGLLLVTWGLRLWQLEQVPPGWRDDELINIHALSGRVLAGHFPLYFTGASGHEPLYHYLHAGVHAVLGFNVLSGHILSIAFGTLAVALTYALARRLFGRTTAVIASLALCTSFWSLMYSRFAMRHVSLPAFALATFLLIPIHQTSRNARGGFDDPAGTARDVLRLGNWTLAGLLLGASLYIYPAARLLPLLLVLFAAYLALFHRDRFACHWRGFLLALAIAVVLAVPLGVGIAQGRSDAAASGIGADARLVELARPIWALRDGDPIPLLETVWVTLNMFHASGDPESLYNIPGRPIFNLVGGGLFWVGLLICLYRWREPRYFFLVLWLGFGLLPTVLSVPPASLSHSILIQPLAYVLPALALVEGYRWLQGRFAHRPQPASQIPLLIIATLIFLAPNAYRDLRDYFCRWPQDSFVRFLYRADYREAAHYLDAHPENDDWAVGSLLMGPWDRLALQVDTQRDDLAVRLFNPERALVYVAGPSPSPVLLTSFPRPSPSIEQLLYESSQGNPALSIPPLTCYALEPAPSFGEEEPVGRFANGLELVAIAWEEDVFPAPGQEALLLASWRVGAPLQLPPMPVVANPPPPGVYSGPRLSVFTHILAADGAFLVGDDGLWLDPLTLRPGDRFIQLHRFTLPPDAPPGPYTLELGLYDPLTGERWSVLDLKGQPVADRLLFAGEENAP